MSRVLQRLRASSTRRRIAVLGAAAVVTGLSATGAALAAGSESAPGTAHHLTAKFSRTIGVYEGNDIRVLGVKVGHVDSLTVDGEAVVVKMTLDDDIKLPSDVRAVVVPPSVVSDRFIQLTPAYTGGPTLADNTTLELDRTAVPLEFDEIFKNLDKLDRALGPQGANKHGALARLVDVSAANLRGNGQAFNSALKQFSAAVTTLSGGRTDLFATVRQLQKFTTTLARNDGGVRALNDNLSKVGTQLAVERHDLGAALANLSTALQLVNSFVADNRNALTGDIHKLTKVTGVLSREKEAVKEVIDMAPFALSNLALAYDPRARTLDTKDDAQEPLADPTGPSGVLCQLLGGPFCTSKKANPASLSDLLAVQR